MNPYRAWVSGSTANITDLPNAFDFSKTAPMLPAAAIPCPIAEIPANPIASPAPTAAQPATNGMSTGAVPNNPKPTSIRIATRKPYRAWVSGSTENNIDLPNIFLSLAVAPNPADAANPWPIADTAAIPTASPAPRAPKP